MLTPLYQASNYIYYFYMFIPAPTSSDQSSVISARRTFLGSSGEASKKSRSSESTLEAQLPSLVLWCRILVRIFGFAFFFLGFGLRSTQKQIQ